MEQLLHYAWRHKMFPLSELQTTDGKPIEVLDPGLHNHNSGPDFFNAKVKIGDTLWVGNVEIHDKSSDWYLHGHDKDKRYDNVILHVAGVIDAQVMNTNGEFLQQMQMDVPDNVRQHYDELIKTDSCPPCMRGWLLCKRSVWNRRQKPFEREWIFVMARGRMPIL